MASTALGVDAVLGLFTGLAALLATAWALGRLALRAGLPPVVGELLTGIVLGPSLLGAVAPGVATALVPPAGRPLLDGVAALGLAMLLALVGLETDLDVVRRERRTTGTVATAGIAVPFALGFALALVLPASLLTDAPRLAFALFLATAMSISAVPVIARILSDLSLRDTPFGQLVVAAALVNDAVGWLLLSLIAGVAAGGVDAAATARTVATLLAVLAVAAALARWGRPAVRALSRAPAPLALFVAAVFAAAAATTALGLEAVLGAFLVGLLVSVAGGLPAETERTYERLTVGVVAPIFFGVAGLRADATTLLAPGAAFAAAATLAVAIVGKFAGTYLGAVGRPRRERLAMGAALNARGAMELVVATIGLRLGVLSTPMYAAIVLVAIVTSVMAPVLLSRLQWDG